MKTFACLSLLALLAAGCQSTGYDDYGYRNGTPRIDDDVFVYVPESDRKGITDARSDYSRMQDSVAVARRDLLQEEDRLDIAEDRLDIAEDEVSTARKNLAVSRDSNEARRSDEIEGAERQLESARSRWRAAQSQVAYHEARIEQLESHVTLALLRVDLAEARIELAKARAVSELDRPEARKVSVRDFESCVEDHETRLAIAEVDADAWERKMELRQKALEERLDDREDHAG